MDAKQRLSKPTADVAKLRAENAALREALKRLDGAYTADAKMSPSMPVIVAYETNSRAHAQARAALKVTK